MLKVECDKDAGFVEITLDGALQAEGYAAVVTAIDDALTQHDKLNLVGVVLRFGPIDWSIWPMDMFFHATHRNWTKRIAIVSDMDAVAPAMQMLAPFYAAKIKCFPLAKLDQARAWARTGSITRSAD